MSDETQSANAEDFMTNIASVSDMVSAINSAKKRGDTSGFLNEEKNISEEAINRLDTLKTMYPELAAEIESFT